MVAVRPPRSAGVCLLLAVLLAIAAVVVGPSGSARALSDSVGPINVTISPTDGLTDGQAISIHATATSGTMSEIRAHICDPAFAAHPNLFNFGFGGTLCSSVAPGTGDSETIQVLANTTSGDLTFKAGIGTATFTDELFGDQHNLTCDSGHGCDLVVQFQSNVLPGTYYFIAPLTYAGAGGTTTSTTTSTTAATTTTTTGTTSTTAGTTSTTTTADGTTTTTAAGGTTTTTTTTAGTTTTTSPAGDGTVTPSSAAPAAGITVNSPGWTAGATVTATLHSDPVTLGTLTADATGKVTGSFTVPAGTAPGAHTIALVGTGSTGTSRTVNIAFTVTAASSATTTAVSVAGSSTGTGSSSLPFTGAYDSRLAGAALLMLGVALLLLSFRPRRPVEL
jgi:hypothetical protein